MFQKSENCFIESHFESFEELQNIVKAVLEGLSENYCQQCFQAIFRRWNTCKKPEGSILKVTTLSKV
jgi:hypothetical protein